ncbi:hypothetical protein AMJ39_00155 [candidate division TA06 bacterium DG_24]|uniref:ABC transporter permease n=3 Tax=Bacteria division TA06 TaxID=1156500 RepID=A0A0S8JMS7_UNCT6|nr:MAG: hypothetical protein AMJ39_00155 [candidate division TA06 bacterium DG_24]KPK69855.1 MAG: hypothetical protein AMJ82_04625 [candidate division TA06 bacterium SM23_40]KPL10966.1 MAG: hypothetical protein AMJ71_01175 [candidate division TA06 bacterium SM1_40]
MRRHEWMVARRYFGSKRWRWFPSAISTFSIGGIFVGVAALLTVLSVMNGFHTELRDKIIGTTSHLVVLRYHNEPVEEYRALSEQIQTYPHVVGVAPFVYSKAMISAESYVDGIVVRGIDPEVGLGVIDLPENIVLGGLALGNEGEDGLPGIILGLNLADNLRAHIGTEVVLATPGSALAPMGVVPRLKKFRVAGVFDAGMYEYNASLAYISLESAQDIFDMGDRVTGLEVKLDDIYRAPAVARAIERDLGYPFRTNDWIELNSNLFRALSLEKQVMFLILALIVVVAAFNIVSSLIMLVIKKTKEIGILKSMGATAGSIMRIFVLEGLILGVIGTVMGVAGGLVLSWVIDRYRFIRIPGEVYFLDTLPVRMELTDFVVVAAASLTISLLATIYPAYRASRLVPVEAIRYE